MSAIIVKFRERTQFWYNDVIKRNKEAGRVECCKNKDLEREKKKAKVGVAGGIELAMEKAPGGAGRCGLELSRHSDNSTLILAYLSSSSSPSLTAKVLQVGFLTLIKLL